MGSNNSCRAIILYGSMLKSQGVRGFELLSGLSERNILFEVSFIGSCPDARVDQPYLVQALTAFYSAANGR